MTNTNTPEIMPLQLADLVPQNATFNLKEIPTPLTLRRWSLRVRDWAVKKYTAKGVRIAFETLDVGIIAEVAFFMLDDESRKNFKDPEAFADSIVTIQDQIAVIKAVSATMGVGEIEFKKITDALTPPAKPESEVIDDPNFAAPSP